MSFGGSKSGFFDTKNFRKDILSKANERLGVIVRSADEGNGTQSNKRSGLLSLLESSYSSDVPSTNYALHLKAIAFESARSLVISQLTRDDIYFSSTRGEYLSQNIASFLFPFSRFPTTDKTEKESRNFYLSIIESYFGGSTKSNIEKTLYRFLEGVNTQIQENFLIARKNGSLDPIINKFTFDVKLTVGDPKIKDINQVRADLEFLIRIIKPAHTGFETKFVFKEYLDVFRNGCETIRDENGKIAVTHDGFEQKIKISNTSICDTFHADIFDYYYEDLRKPSSTFGVTLISDEVIQEEDTSRQGRSVYQASPRIPISNVGGNWKVSNESEYHTKYGPFAKKNGNVADSVNDITVYVNGVESKVSEIFPLSGAFKLLNKPPSGSTVKVSYWVIRNYTGALTTNDPDSVINNFRNSGTEHNFSNVLPPTGFSPIGSDYNYNVWEQKSRYKGFDLFNSSVLNSPLTLNLNESDSRSKFNDYAIFKSYGYDEGRYSPALRESTPLFSASFDLKDASKKLYNQQVVLNNSEFILNSIEDRMFGDIHHYAYHPFFSSLAIDQIDNGGQKSILQTIDEDPVSGLQIEFSRSFEEKIPRLGKDYDTQFYSFPTGSGYIGLQGYEVMTMEQIASSGYATLTNDPRSVIFGGSGSWSVTNAPTRDYPIEEAVGSNYPENAVVDYHFGGNHGQMHTLIHDVYHENYTGLSVYDSLPQVEEEIKNLPYTNIFQLNAFEKVLDKAFRIKEYGKNTSLTFQVNNSILTLNPLDNAIVPVSLSTITSVRNNSKKMDYDITGLILYGDKVFTLDESNPTNIAIGYNSGDEILVSYTAINKMNDNYEIVRAIRNPVEIKFITQQSIFELISVFNVTKNAFYNLTDYEILGDKIINLKKGLPENLLIGFEKNDQIKTSYLKRNLTREIVSATALPNNFLKFKINSSNQMVTTWTLKNITKNKFYDLTNLKVLNSENNVILLNDDSVRNILLGQDPDDLYEVAITSIDGYTYIEDEDTETVESPYRFRFINVKPIDELVSLTNVTLQQNYDLTDYSNITVSSGEFSAPYALISGDNTATFDNAGRYWQSVGSNDVITETISITFPVPKTINSISLVGHNWKSYKIQYFIGIELFDFPTSINVNNNSSYNTVHIFNEIEVSNLFITITQTIQPNEDKKISKVIYLLKDMIELDYTSAENHRIGMRYGDIVYSNTRSITTEKGIEPYLCNSIPMKYDNLGKPVSDISQYNNIPEQRQHNRSIFEILPV